MNERRTACDSSSKGKYVKSDRGYDWRIRHCRCHELVLIPSGVYSTGFTGLAQILTQVLQNTAFAFGENVWFLALNIPLIVLAWIMLGRSFTIVTLISVLATTIFIGLIPQYAVIPGDQTLNAVFGGVLLAIGTGITIKFGASTGGFDIVALIFARFPIAVSAYICSS